MSDQLRISDAEREQAAADLGEHYAEGRLTADEHSERLDRIWAAKTRGEIAPIFADLPSPYAARAPRETARTGPRRGPAGYRGSGFGPWRRGFPVPILAVLAILLVVGIVTHFPLILIGLAIWAFVMLKHRAWQGRGQGWR